MFTPAFAQLMARYTEWQNASMYKAAGTLSEEARRLDRGAFFNSIHETLAHIVWADQIWLSRFGGCSAPEGGIPESTSRYADWSALSSARKEMDRLILIWADNLKPDAIEGEMSWFSGAAGREITRPRWLLMQQMFNHGTHHRGQVHAMLTAAGATPEDTDVPFMPSLDS